jgi:hypothetical protein
MYLEKSYPIDTLPITNPIGLLPVLGLRAVENRRVTEQDMAPPNLGDTDYKVLYNVSFSV